LPGSEAAAEQVLLERGEEALSDGLVEAVALKPIERVGCTYSIFLQIERIRDAAEFVHPTR
jgi:hypothetical protein